LYVLADIPNLLAKIDLPRGPSSFNRRSAILAHIPFCEFSAIKLFAFANFILDCRLGLPYHPSNGSYIVRWSQGRTREMWWVMKDDLAKTLGGIAVLLQWQNQLVQYALRQIKTRSRKQSSSRRGGGTGKGPKPR
jgi:hypothetical protein